MPRSRGSSKLRDGTQVSRIAGGFFTVWATREVQDYWSGWPIPSPGEFLELGSPALQMDSLQSELPGKLPSIEVPCGLVLGWVQGV